MPEQARHLANKYEDIVNLQGMGAYCGSFPHSLLAITLHLLIENTIKHS